MKILLVLQLSSKKCLDKLTPLLNSEKIKELLVIRKEICVESEKIRWISPKNNIWKKGKFLYNLWRTFKLIAIIGKERPDKIISFYFFPHGLITTSIAKIFRINIVNSLIGTDLSHHLNRTFYSKILRRKLNSSHIITVSGVQTKKFAISKGIDEHKIKILPNSINTKNFLDININKEYDFIFLGNLTNNKRVDLTIKILDRLTKENGNYNLAIAGEGPEKENLLNLIKKLNIEENISFLGYRKDIVQLLNKSRYLFLLSKSEGFPAVIVEAMCCGVIPIVTDVGDVTEICENRVNSIVVQDNEMIIETILEEFSIIEENKELYGKMIEKAKAIGKSFNYSRTAEAWDDIL